MKVGIIGVGLMGGSFALALKKKRLCTEIFGWDVDQVALAEAEELGIVDKKAGSLQMLIQQVDFIIISIPVDAIEKELSGILDHVTPDQTVIDFGSTKSLIQQSVVDHPKRHQYIAAHPIAGTEYSGPSAAFPGLYQGKVMIICDRDHSDTKSIEQFEDVCEQLEMKIDHLESRDHDLHLAYVSHLSHVMAFGLSNTVLEKEKEQQQILDLAGSGFDSTVRLAKSDPNMWVPIFLKNREFILQSIDDFTHKIDQLRTSIDQKDHTRLYELLDAARKIRKILK